MYPSRHIIWRLELLRSANPRAYVAAPGNTDAVAQIVTGRPRNKKFGTRTGRRNSRRTLSWLHGQVKTPPSSKTARIESGFLLRRLRQGEELSVPQSRPMPSIAASCHELRVNDEGRTRRLMYRLDADAIPILAVFAKKTGKTPDEIIRICRKRLRDHDDASRKAKAPRSKGLEGRRR
jgi:phage-related protein